MALVSSMLNLIIKKTSIFGVGGAKLVNSRLDANISDDKLNPFIPFENDLFVQ